MAANSPYPVEAFYFVAQGLRASPAPGVHVTAAVFCWYLHDLALSEYGANAADQLKQWGLHSCRDFGVIVYELVAAGFVRARDEDSIEQFDGVFDFATAFREFHGRPQTQQRPRWRLSTMFAGTTLVAIAAAGVSKAEPNGWIATLFFSWLAVTGAYCGFANLRQRSQGWLLGTLIGFFFALAGAAGFVAVVINARMP
ncbi:MAG: hypothetical protein KDA42_03725 [Planctomycetales bacterium]|nr:hypothetical protein [Planctomycetales bacterium]